MGVKEGFYYIGVGVLHHDGKDYGYGQKLPDGMPAATIDSLKGKGKVSTTQPSKEGVAIDNALGALQDKVKQLIVERDQASEAASAGSVEIARLQEQLAMVQGERDAARNTVTERDQTIEDLTKQLMTPATPAAPAAPVEQGAGPKGKQK